MSKLLYKSQISNKPNIYMYILTICRESAFKCLDCKGISDHRNLDIEVIISHSEAISPKLQHDYQRDEAITKNLSKFLH